MKKTLIIAFAIILLCPELVEGRHPELVEGLPLTLSWPVLSVVEGPVLSPALSRSPERSEGSVEGVVEGPVLGVSGAQAAHPFADSPIRRLALGIGNRTHKVVAPPGLLDTEAEGVELLFDYGSYALYRISTAGLTGLASETRAQVRVVDEMDKILLDAYLFNTQTDTLDLPSTLRVDQPSGPLLFLIQFVGPIKAEWLEAVEAAGVTLIHYVANNAYLVWADVGGVSDADIRPFADSPPFLQYSAPYHPYFKLGPSIRRRAFQGRLSKAAADEIVPVVVQIYDHAGKSDTQNIIRNLTVEQLAPWTAILAYQNTILKVRAGDLETIAMLPDVVWVGERFERERMDEVQGQILAGNFDAGQTGPSGPGYLAWLNGYGFSTDPNAYPVVDIVDDGIGNGTVNSGDSTSHRSGVLANPTRLSYVADCTSAADGGGPDGHGHINVSIAGGYDTRAGSPYQDGDGFQRGLGINPYGRFAGTRIFDPEGFDLSDCGGTDTGLIKHSQDSGARIASNSWGCGGCAGSYDDSSQAFDVGVRDADLTEVGNQELIFIFAAGNDGPGSSTVGTPGNGKNMITVGASENDRPTWTDGCGVSSTGADNVMDVINFSSRGPSPGNRVKPEVIAPGTHIQGTASTHSSYNGSGVCDQYQPTGQTIFAASSGTSHSTPAVAGVASLYYYWLENTYGLTPSPALMKAYLIAHPTYLTGVGANDALPSNNQGYGMPDMDLAFDDTSRFLVNQSVVFDNSGETWTWSGAVADPSKPVRVVLAYTDQAGAIGTSPQVNDLNLAAAILEGGTTYLGNVFSGQWSTSGGSSDAANNYEAIFLPAGTTGAISIVVTAFNVGGDGVPNTGDTTDQDFALVCYNCSLFPDFTLSATPTSQSTCAPADAVYDITVGQIMGFTDAVTLTASETPPTTNVNFSVNPVTPPGTSVLTIGNTGAATAGSYSINIVGMAATPPNSTHTDTVQLDLFTGAPGTVTLVSPSNGATDVDTQPTLEWSVGVGDASYDLEVASDAGFSNLVYTTTVTTISHTLASSLNYSTLYYWRVTAQNTCGSGGPSAVSSLTTRAAPLVFCSTPSLAIPDDDSSGVADSLTVGAFGSILDLNVAITATHTWVGDLFFTLEHVDTGTSVTIIDRPGVPDSTYGCSGNDIDATLDDEAATPVEDECASTTPAISGSFFPNNPLSGFDGKDMAGTWTLTVSDNAGQDTGTLDRWCLHSVLASSHLEISKSGPSTANAGDLITYTLTITKSGTGAASNLVITDAIPVGATYASGGTRVGDVVSWTVASLSAGNSVGVQFVVTATQTITNSDYRASADGGYHATGSTAVVTVISAGCEPISGVQLSRTPAGDLFTGNTVRFTADANGTVPFTYTWTLNGTAVGENMSTFEHTFDTADTYAVGVAVANTCGQGDDAMVVEVQVQEPALEQPDLSQSYKSVNLTSVESGDTLTYTLFLRNSSAVTVTAILTDPIPAHTTYILGSARASDGNPVTLAGGQLFWSGQVISGTLVVIEFAVEVLAAPVGTPITNAARVDDGLGNVVVLEANSTYNPGYGLTINDGALYTNIPTVTLSLLWGAVAPPIEYMYISNDGGFGSGTGWIAVTSTYEDWVLATYGNLLLPRTVYAKFRDASGQQYGPIQDDIIYDPNPPQVTQVEIIPQTAQSISAMQGQDVFVRVTASDDSSGVSKVQVSHSAGFDQFFEFAVTGSMTDIPWTLQFSGAVYVRVVDRAGNISPVSSGSGPAHNRIYLPLVVKPVSQQ